MGHWGPGPLDNDAALDVVHVWNGHLARLRAGEELSAEEIADFFLELDLGNTMDSGDADTTSRLIALAELFTREGLEIPPRARGYFEEAINWELREDALVEWDTPAERREALEGLLQRIGGKRRKIRKSKLFRHPALEFETPKAFVKKLEYWLTLRRDHRLDPTFEEEYPRFWHVLDRVMNNQLLTHRIRSNSRWSSYDS